MKTAIYVRVSTDEQAKEGYSIRAQIDKLKSYIQIKEWDFYKVYADEGISGKNIKDRPAINEMINDIKTGRVNNVLVYKIDRLTRSTKDLIELTEIFKECSCSFNSVMESIDTRTASGRMFLKIIGIFAEFERENIIERITLACEKKVKEGYTLATYVASYGYDRFAGDKIQKINPEEAKIVKEIFAMFIDNNMSYNEIAKNLNLRGIKSKLNHTWCGSMIRGVLVNANLVGKVRYATDDKERYFEAEGKHEPIISEELFYRVQKKMEKIARKVVTKRPKENHYFCGTLYCGICGAKLRTHGFYKTNKHGEKTIQGNYRCPNTAKGLCVNPVFSQRKADVAFQEYMNDTHIKVNDDILFGESEQRTNTDSINTMIKEEYENAIAKLDKKEKDLMSFYINERITFDEYEKMASLIVSEKNTYFEQIKNIPTEPSEDIILSRADIITSFRENWKLLTNAEKMEFLTNYIEKITAVSKKEEGEYHHKVKVLKVQFYDD